MKQITTYALKMVLLIVGLLSSLIAFAQEEAPFTIDIDAEGGAFYTQLWFWVVIALVCVFLLVLLIRGGGRKKPKKEEAEQPS